MRRGAAAVVVALCVLVLAGCGLLPAPDATSTPILRGVDPALTPYYGQRLVWKDCGDGYRCTTARAPLDWSDPDGARIRLALAMRPASGDRIGTLFTNPGGPGVAGVDFLKTSGDTFFDRALRDRYDIVSWDPRGVGRSSAVDCYGTAGLDRFLFADPDEPEGSPALARAVDGQGEAFGAACATRTGALLAHVGTADTVRDLDMLRAAVGSTKLDYFGFSYGTYIGALYADRFGPNVGRMVLDGAVDPSKSTFEESLANTRAFGDALQAYLRHCLRSSSCPFTGLTVGGSIERIADLLLSLRASPVRAADGREVNSAVLRTAINAALYDEGSWKYLTQGFEGIQRGDPGVVQALADSYVERGPKGYTGNLFEAIYAINCLDKPVTSDPAAERREGERIAAADPLRAADNTEDLGDPVCSQWPVPVQGEVKRVTAASAPPILVLGTTGDPATPYAWAQSVAGQLPGGVLLTLQGEGHTAYRTGNACINRRVDDYLVTGTVPAPIRCG